jgi:hypothetical protein
LDEHKEYQMKRLALAVTAVFAAVVGMVVFQGCDVLGGPPSGVEVRSGPDESDSTVMIAWTAPAEGSPDKYLVYFRALRESGYTVLGETTATVFYHNPHEVTGQYKIVALFGADSYDALDKPTTIPIESDSATLYEINADSSRCGYGWSRDSGFGGVYGMTDSIFAESVDFYISDLAVGYSRAPYAIVSPNKADSIDPGAAGIVPSAEGWRKNGFSNPLAGGQGPLPSYAPPPNANYFIYTEIPQGTGPFYIACYTAGEQEKHYGLIQVNSVDVGTGAVQIKTWYQLVPGLRLIQH